MAVSLTTMEEGRGRVDGCIQVLGSTDVLINTVQDDSQNSA